MSEKHTLEELTAELTELHGDLELSQGERNEITAIVRRARLRRDRRIDLACRAEAEAEAQKQREIEHAHRHKRDTPWEPTSKYLATRKFLGHQLTITRAKAGTLEMFFDGKPHRVGGISLFEEGLPTAKGELETLARKEEGLI